MLSLIKTICLAVAMTAGFSRAIPVLDSDFTEDISLVQTEARTVTSTPWPSRVFAPYCDVLLWPTFDISSTAAAVKNKHFTLAFITADGGGKASWGGMVPLAQNFYSQYISQLRQLGGDVIVSFGGANGQELALVSSNNLVAEYKSVIDMYSLTYVDFDIEGGALFNSAANTRRAQALVQIKKLYPNIKISYTLPVLPSGLTAEGVAVLSNAAANGLVIDVVNIMAMDYGSGPAPNGATGMGGYAISAAKATYAQAKPIFPSVTIGVTPMIGVNDVQGEVFRVEDAAQLTQFAQSTSWISLLSFWSINRDHGVIGPLFASSRIQQSKYDFATAMLPFELSASVAKTPVPAPKLPLANIPGLYNWPSTVFAPTIDTTAANAANIVTMATTVGTNMYNLGYIVADANANPSWGGAHGLPESWYLSQIQQVRNFGGDVMVSLGGPNGQELAQVITNPSQLKNQYQNIIDSYSISWLDFYLDGAALTNQASIDTRNAAIRGLQVAMPNLKITYTLPATASGLLDNAVYVLTSAYNAGVRVDVVNALVAPASVGATLASDTTPGAYTTAAVQAAYAQAQGTGLLYFKMGITPVIASQNFGGKTFGSSDANVVLQFARSTSYVTYMSYSTANTDSESQVVNVLRRYGV
ncbi:hypothetical protein BDV3_002777 [Batrachochytrium dendrobatidis]